MIGTAKEALQAEFKAVLRTSGTSYGVIAPGPEQGYTLAGAVRANASRKRAKLSGRIPAAMWLAHSVQRPTIYVEVVEGGYWVLAASPGEIDPRGDVALSGDEAAQLASRILSEAVEAGQEPELVVWPTIEAMPAAMPLPGATRTASLEALLSATPPKARVGKHVGLPTWVPMAALVVVCATVGYTGFEKISTAVENSRLAEAARRDAERQEANRLLAERELQQRLAEHAQSHLDAMLDTPSPTDAVDACLGATHRLPAMLGGWYLSAIDCDEMGQAQGTYTQSDSLRGRATQATFRSAAERRGYKSDYGWFQSTASIQLPAPPLALRNPPQISSLPGTLPASTALSSHGQRVAAMYEGVTFRAERPQDIDLPALEGQEVTAAYRTSKLRIDGTGLWSMPGIIPEGGNVALSRITLTSDETQRWTWVVEGQFITAID